MFLLKSNANCFQLFRTLFLTSLLVSCLSGCSSSGSPASPADTTPPVITLLGNNPTTIDVHSTYIDAGATALDNADGDITASIFVNNQVNSAVVGTYTVTYIVFDAAGNKSAPVTRTVHVIDQIPPVITILGANPYTVVGLGQPYNDPGATALDNADGDITANIVVNNPVNTAVAGTYTVTYDVTDSSGNAATQKTRTVYVVASVSASGTDFYAAFPKYYLPPASFRLIATSQSNNSGTVTFQGTPTPFTVTAGTPTIIDLYSTVELSLNNTVESKGVHVTSVTPITLHAVAEGTGAGADGSLIHPLATLGSEYYVMSHNGAATPGSEFAIVATQANTTVTITPSVALQGSHAAGTPYNVILNAGDTYLNSSVSNVGDVTGSHIIADKPIAVFGGNQCGDVPYGVLYCDYLYEQLPAVPQWGKEYLVVPHATRAADTIRVLASMNATTVSINGGASTLNAGAFLDMSASTSTQIIADKPVLVAQFMQGSTTDGNTNADPSMTIITPVAQYQNNQTFGVYGLTGSTGIYLNIVTDTGNIASLMLDGVAVNPASFTPIGTSLYSGAQIPVSAGEHSVQGTGKSAVTVYGFQSYGSYGYQADTGTATLP